MDKKREVKLLEAIRRAARPKGPAARPVTKDEDTSWQHQREGRAALEELLIDNYDWIMSYSIAKFGDVATANDCIQMVLERVARGIYRFEGRSELKTWIFSILRRTVAEVRRRSRHFAKHVLLETPERLESAAASSPETAVGAVEKLILSEESSVLLDYVRTLPRMQRDAVLLHYFEDYSVREAAKVLGCSESSFKTHLFRARRKLKKLLGDKPQRLVETTIK